MAKKKAASKRPAARKPPVKIPLDFDSALGGLLAMTPTTARKVNKKVADKRRELDGRDK